MGQQISRNFGGIVIMKLAEGEAKPQPNMFCHAVSLNTVKCSWEESSMVIGKVHSMTFKSPIKETLEMENEGLVYVTVPSYVGSDDARKLVEIEWY